MATSCYSASLSNSPPSADTPEGHDVHLPGLSFGCFRRDVHFGVEAVVLCPQGAASRMLSLWWDTRHSRACHAHLSFKERATPSCSPSVAPASNFAPLHAHLAKGRSSPMSHSDTCRNGRNWYCGTFHCTNYLVQNIFNYHCCIICTIKQSIREFIDCHTFPRINWWVQGSIPEVS